MMPMLLPRRFASILLLLTTWGRPTADSGGYAVAFPLHLGGQPEIRYMQGRNAYHQNVAATISAG